MKIFSPHIVSKNILEKEFARGSTHFLVLIEHFLVLKKAVTSFDLYTFIAAPSQALLNLAKKSLLDIAAHYELTTINKSMLKHEIKNILVQFFGW